MPGSLSPAAMKRRSANVRKLPAHSRLQGLVSLPGQRHRVAPAPQSRRLHVAARGAPHSLEVFLNAGSPLS